MHGAIEFVDDDDMPDGHDFILVAEDDAQRIFYRRSAITPETLARSWEAYRLLVGIERTPPPPRLRAVV